VAISSAPGKLIGREHDLAVLNELLETLGEGSSGALFITGEPGIGKTALLTEGLEGASRLGCRVVSGRGAEFERDLPFGVFSDALEDELVEMAKSATPEDRHTRLRSSRAALNRLAEHQPLVLGLDDLHWADAASMDLICHLLHRPLEGRVLLLLAARRGQTPARLETAMTELERRGDARRIELAPLSAPEARELLGESFDHEMASQLYVESGGNPFYLEQLGAAITRRGGSLPTSSAKAYEDVVPSAVNAAIAEELDALTELARIVLQGAAVTGESFEPGNAADAAGVSEADVLAVLDELSGRDLIRLTETARRFRFRHPIVRRAVYERAGAGWTMEAHRRCSAALERRGAPATVRAHHVERSASVGDVDAAATLAEAGEQSAAHAPASAAHWFEAALRLLPEDQQNAQRRLELLTQRATALGVAGHLEDARDALRELLKLLPPDPTVLRRRAISILEVLQDVLGNYEECRRMLERELSNLSDQRSPAAMEIWTWLSINSLLRNDLKAVRDATGHALAAQPSTADVQIAALSLLALGEHCLGDGPRAKRAASDAAALFEQLSDAHLAAHNPGVTIWLGWAEISIDRIDEAIRHLARAVRVARDAGQRHLTTPMLFSQAQALLVKGRFAEVSAIADSAMEDSLLMANEGFKRMAMTLRCELELRTGDPHAAVEYGEQAVGAGGPGDPSSGLTRTMLAEALLEVGEAKRCRELLVGDGGLVLAPIPVLQSLGYRLLTRASIALEDLDAAERFAEKAAEVAQKFPQESTVAIGCATKAVAQLARGHTEIAAEQAQLSVAATQKLGFPLENANARLLLGEALAATGDRESAIAEVESAHADLRRLGAAIRYQDRAASFLRKLGRVVPRGVRGGTPLEGLSKRELQVLELVAEGKTNRQIASDLFLSVRTIDRHVARIFEKLGVSSRVTAASMFERLEAMERSS
jgi:DNA-binding NarL/FixJ family response regulator